MMKSRMAIVALVSVGSMLAGSLPAMAAPQQMDRPWVTQIPSGYTTTVQVHWKEAEPGYDGVPVSGYCVSYKFKMTGSTRSDCRNDPHEKERITRGLNECSEYDIKVAAKDDNGNRGPWSFAKSIRVEGPGCS